MINEIAKAAKRVIVLTPTELVSDLYENGAMMTGISQSKELAERIEEK